MTGRDESFNALALAAASTQPRFVPPRVAGKENDSHWWVATQDRALRDALGQLPAVPLIFATANGVHLQQPPHLSRSVAQQARVA